MDSDEGADLEDTTAPGVVLRDNISSDDIEAIEFVVTIGLDDDGHRTLNGAP